MTIPTCKNCGNPLPLFRRSPTRPDLVPSTRGYNGNGVFCTQRCGYDFGLRMVLRILPMLDKHK
jgi:hypothetical protein